MARRAGAVIAACCARVDSAKRASPTRSSCARIARSPLRILEAQPLRRQVIVATCGLLIPFALAAIWSANRTRVERDEEVALQAESVAHTAAAYLDEYFSGLDSMASALTRHPAVLTLERAENDRLFAEV